MVDRLETPNWVERRVQEALAGKVIERVPPANPIVATTRWALEALSLDPQPHRLPHLLGALGVLELAKSHASHSHAALSMARQALLRLPRRGDEGAYDSSVDVQVKIRAWAAFVVEDFQASDRVWSQAIASFWLLALAMERLDFRVAPHVLSAVDALLRRLVHDREHKVQSLESPDKNLTHRQNLLQSLLGLAALEWLHSTTHIQEKSVIDRQIRRIHSILQGAANGLQLPSIVQANGRQPFELALERLVSMGPLQESEWAIPPLLAAYDRLDEAWHDSIPPDALFVLLGRV
jgi:hypothetical protein